MIHRVVVLLALLACVGWSCGPGDEDVRRIVKEEMRRVMERTIVSPVEVAGPYSPAVRVGNFLFVSGQIGLDQKTGSLRNETIETETRQVLDNLMTILRVEGYDSTHVVSATVYLKNISDYPKMNLIYGGYFQEGNYPSRATVEVSNLPKQANVEISLIAYK